MDFRYEVISKSAAETRAAGQALAYILKKGMILPRVITLYGELGSGKTTFVQGFAKGLGITGRLVSPTFIIVRRYTIPKDLFSFYHIDLYRTFSLGDLEQIGVADILSDIHGIIAFEWAQKLGKYLPNERIDVHFDMCVDQSHKITVEHVKK